MQLISSFPYHDRGIQKQLWKYLGASIISIENKMLDSELGMKWLPRYISHNFMVKTSESLCIVLCIVKSKCFRLELSSFFYFLFIYLFILPIQVPYLQIRKNNWTLNADMNGKWNVKFDLWARKEHDIFS
jgi:hypothetical protein